MENKTLEFRLPYVSYPDAGLACKDPSLTKQSFSEECDFNAVLGKWEKTGVLEHINPLSPQFADVSILPDYQAAMNTVISAEAAFNALPAAVRDRFANSPGKLVAFLQNADNEAEAIKLGLIVDKSEALPQSNGDLSTKQPQAAPAAPAAEATK